MPTLDEVLALARQLSPSEREQLAQSLAVPTRPAATPLAMLQNRPPAPQSVAWVKAERGHAVLATDTGPSEADIPVGAEAIAGMWADMKGDQP